MRFSHVLLLTTLVLITAGAYIYLVPVNLPNEIKVEIPNGASVDSSGIILKEAGVIHSKEGYVLLTRVLYPAGINAGRYSFSGRVTMFSVVYRVAHGQFGTKQIRITIPEGFTNQEIINRISANFPNIDKSALTLRLNNSEGYIYPETYFFDFEASLDEIVTKIITTGNEKISAIIKPIDITSSEAERILIIASLVEAEGKNKDEREMIAGIINNRIDVGMPLQLDATLTYLTNHGTSQITQADLKNPSLYNTYVHVGLPPGPINNPSPFPA